MTRDAYGGLSDVANDNLGGWKAEFEATDMMTHNSQNFVARLTDSTLRVRGVTMHRMVESGELSAETLHAPNEQGQDEDANSIIATSQHSFLSSRPGLCLPCKKFTM